MPESKRRRQHVTRSGEYTGMIGVSAHPEEFPIVREFFELFKTPWEFYRSDREYEVLLCTGDRQVRDDAARLVVIYSGRKLAADAHNEEDARRGQARARVLAYKSARIPIYGDSITFGGRESGFLVDADSARPVAYVDHSGGRAVARIGYDLFREVGTLLTAGQPASNAGIPSLDLHIAMLRELIVESGAKLVEIPPVPEGYRFIACLTHDVDHPSIRSHRLDHTMWGFLYRSVFGSVFNALRGRASASQVLRNWAAAVKLPFVYLGVAKDFWCEFDRYPKLERGRRSSFFVIPFKNRPGRTDSGPAPRHRAAGYSAAEIARHIQTLRSVGCEIGLHGIDAWLDGSKGREELEEIRRITGAQEVGVRMHWLYFDERSPLTLEQAGADYDSTIGYNDAVGYRAGTAQAYQPLGTARLIELPLHIMDTALFFPNRLNLSPEAAGKQVGAIIDNAVRFGGSVTVNWHDRSVAPERCWGEFYVALLDELESKGAWFATAAEAVSWFRMRRTAAFEYADGESDVRVKMPVESGRNLPALQIRVRNARESQAGLRVS
jgi:hypothetical protein